jgi:hypothetical protein
VALGGNRRAVGFNNLVDGDTVGISGSAGAGDSGGAGRRTDTSGTGLEKALEKVRANHFKNKPE